MKNKEQEIKEEIEDRKSKSLTTFKQEAELKGYQTAKQEFEKEKSKWIEERGRMAKLLFEKGVKSW